MRFSKLSFLPAMDQQRCPVYSLIQHEICPCFPLAMRASLFYTLLRAYDWLLKCV